MKQAGQVVLFRFPQTDLEEGKLRPALLLGRLSGDYEDWLMCMISSQLYHHVVGFDEMVQTSDADFTESGLKVPGVIRVARLAVVADKTLQGAIGQISRYRLERIKKRLAEWLVKD